MGARGKKGTGWGPESSGRVGGVAVFRVFAARAQLLQAPGAPVPLYPRSSEFRFFGRPCPRLNVARCAGSRVGVPGVSKERGGEEAGRGGWGSEGAVAYIQLRLITVHVWFVAVPLPVCFRWLRASVCSI